MKNTIQILHRKLSRNKMTIAVAESCTGGALSRLLTKYPGSSLYFALGVTAYSNKAKVKFLQIPQKTIDCYGAVSEVTAKLMAKNIKSIAQTDCSLSTTGIAGPAGALKNKPVGTVYIGACAKNKIISKKFRFSGRRAQIINQACLQALKMLKQLIPD